LYVYTQLEARWRNDDRELKLSLSHALQALQNEQEEEEEEEEKEKKRIPKHGSLEFLWPAPILSTSLPFLIWFSTTRKEYNSRAPIAHDYWFAKKNAN
jgi:hypothetical protein